MSSGWRTVVINRHEELEMSDNQLIIKSEEQAWTVPLEQVRDVMVAHPSGSVSFSLLQRLTEDGVNVVLCDRRHEPAAQLIPLGGHLEGAGHLLDQAAWTQRRKDALWKQIVRQKIIMQTELLEQVNHAAAKDVSSYAGQVRPGDSTNREGAAAKVYFRALFGDDFVRHGVDDVNAALNYGYTILNTAVSRAIVSHGYNTALGIHHCNRLNYVNLSCDLMEPFRPLVDAVVAANADLPLDWPYRQQLIGVLQCTCRLDGKEYKLGDALDLFILQAMDVMQGERKKLGVISFA
ncbi:MAG: type II CRISPR-associated endonuclease Cas1 [Clostridia bacterium]|nr:type II CRISPR-associated endonuclease Cas1 [Clostridia bacterium]